MKITIENYSAIVKQIGLKSLPAELQETHHYLKEATGNFKNWNIKTKDFQELKVLAFEKLGKIIKGLNGLNGKNDPPHIRQAKEDTQSYQYMNAEQLKRIYTMELSAVQEGDATPEEGKIRINAIEKLLKGEDTKWALDRKRLMLGNDLGGSHITPKQVALNLIRPYVFDGDEASLKSNNKVFVDDPNFSAHVSKGKVFVTMIYGTKINEVFSVEALTEELASDFLENKEGKAKPKYDAYREVQLMEKIIDLNGKIVLKKEIKEVIDELQDDIKNKKIRKFSPYADAVNALQSLLIRHYNTGGAKKFTIDKSSLTLFEDAILDYFNDPSAKDDDTVNPIDLSGTDSTVNEPKEIILSEELSNKEFKTIGFTGKWLQLIGDPAPGFSAMVFGKPKMGKSFLCVEFAGYLAKNFGKVLYVSKEEKRSPTFIIKLREKDAISPNLFIADEVPTDLSEYDFIFLDSVSATGLNPEQLRKLKDSNPGKSFIFVFQTTKAGAFRGNNTFQHDVDIVIEVPERGKAIQFGRYNQGGEMSIFNEDASFESQEEIPALAGVSRKNKKLRPQVHEIDHSKLMNKKRFEILIDNATPKADRWEKITALDIAKFGTAMSDFLDTLPLITQEEFPDYISPAQDLPVELQGKMFLIQRNEKIYFLDTQGYKYGRYFLECKNYDPGMNTINKAKRKKTGFNEARYANRSDAENPAYIFSLTSTQVLVEALKGDFDLKYMVRRELANRGQDENGQWVGFEEAAQIHNIKD